MATKKDFAGMMRRDTPTFNIDLGTFDITGYTFRLTIKKLDDNTTDDTNAILATSWTSHINNFETAVTLTKTQTNFAGGIYKYDIQMANANTTHTILYGEWEQIEDVTITAP
jgi:hypothetical protein